METIKLKARVGQDGILKLEVPTKIPNQEVEVVIVLAAQPPKLDWESFIEATYGSLADNPIELI